MRVSQLLLLVPSLTQACLPGLGWNPYMGGLGGLGGLGGFGGGLGYPYNYGRIGPFRSQANSQANHDSTGTSNVLNCRALDEGCKWSNTNQDELDWVSGKTNPNVQGWWNTLGTTASPDLGAGALITRAKQPWEEGKLISDPLPCISQGLRITATAWSSKLGPIESQPKLEVCSKNTNEVLVARANCVEFPIRNGVPIEVNVPLPNDPAAQAQIILKGYNFIAPEGGAIFVQDIRLDGDMECSTVNKPDEHPTLVEPLAMPNLAENNFIEDRPVPAPQPAPELASFAKYSTSDRNSIDLLDAPPPPSNPFKSLASENVFTENSVSIVQGPDRPESPKVSNGLFETCLAISCDATDYLNCNFWRSSGGSQWEIASAKRIASPKTAITSAPGGAERFLVAPFNDVKHRQFSLVSEAVTIPPDEEVFFCFYEALSAKGFSLSVCTDANECFYRKVTEGNEAKDWAVKCTKLPPGTYELRVHAENHGTEQGELGFLPVRLSRDATASELIC